MLLLLDLLYAIPPAKAEPPTTAANNRTRLEDHDETEEIPGAEYDEFLVL
jgi:hypothetical protein